MPDFELKVRNKTSGCKLAQNWHSCFSQSTFPLMWNLFFVYWSFVKDLCIHSAMILTKKICSNRADLLKSACRKSPPVCRFSQICHWTFVDVCLQKSPPPVCGFSQICHWTFTKKPACRNSPPGLQIFQNLPLESYLHVLAEIPPPTLQIFSNLPLTADLLKSACRNSPLPF